MKIRVFTLFLGLILASLTSFAQTGTIRGTVYDDTTGEPIMFGDITVVETNDYVQSDLDGAFSVDVAPGVYTLKFEYIGLAELNVSEIQVTEGQVTTISPRMKTDDQVLDVVEVTAKQTRDNEAAMVTIKKKATNLIDGISAQTFSKLGDSNAGEALKRVTGVSVEGGKHVYVRGLGDRYTKTILNGMEVPGLDPDKNSFEMDLLPTNLIDNILVFKSFTPDLPGDFTGGVVDVLTKDYPEEQFTNVSVGLGYNPSMHFNSDFIRQERSGTDLLAFDDGSRQNPISGLVPSVISETATVADYTSRFKDNAGVVTSSNNLNKSFSVATGNQITNGTSKYSYIAAVNYKNNSTFYDNAKFATFKYDNQVNAGDYILEKDVERSGKLGEENTLLSGLIGLGYKVNNHRFTFKAMRLQNGISKAASQNVTQFRENVDELKREVLEYAQREVTNFNLSGKHVLKEKLTVNWKLSPTFVQVDEPDIRYAAFAKTDDGKWQIAESVGANVSRSWRNLKESNYSGKLDLEYDLGKEDSDRVNKVKVGALATQKDRTFGITNFNFVVKSQEQLGLNGEAANVFNPENIITASDRTRGVYVEGGSEPANSFEASQFLYSAYVMHTMNFTDKLKAIYGVRYENAQNKYTGVNNSGTKKYDNEVVFDAGDFLPSLNLVYALQESSNLRASYNRTLARPTFKEISIAQIQDRISGRTFLGNIDLKRTIIDNYDLRYELFASGGQAFSVSGFYKRFQNPIELIAYSDLAPDNFQPQNVAKTANVYGAEFELVNKLDFLSSALSDFTAGINLTYVNSRIKRQNAENFPEDEQYRPMVGQSPYIVNASLGYNNVEQGYEVNASYNVQGKKLFIAGSGSLADVYTQPFNSLNLKASKKFGEDNKYKVSLTANNILGDVKEKLYEAPYTAAQKGQTVTNKTGLFELLEPGRTISLGFSAKL